MGEMADYTLDQVEDVEAARLEHRLGQCDPQTCEFCQQGDDQ
jgi:hypothetical protein